jgi:hypothetical protein
MDLPRKMQILSERQRKKQLTGMASITVCVCFICPPDRDYHHFIACDFSGRRAIDQEKVVYKESFERLKVLKPEIEHIRKVCVHSTIFVLILIEFC